MKDGGKKKGMRMEREFDSERRCRKVEQEEGGEKLTGREGRR